MSALLNTAEAMTVEEFLTWDAPGGGRWELRNGVPVAMAPANGTHSMMQGEIARLIGNHLAAHRPGCFNDPQLTRIHVRHARSSVNHDQ